MSAPSDGRALPEHLRDDVRDALHKFSNDDDNSRDILELLDDYPVQFHDETEQVTGLDVRSILFLHQRVQHINRQRKLRTEIANRLDTLQIQLERVNQLMDAPVHDDDTRKMLSDATSDRSKKAVADFKNFMLKYPAISAPMRKLASSHRN
jgi:hypothetical protein